MENILLCQQFLLCMQAYHESKECTYKALSMLIFTVQAGSSRSGTSFKAHLAENRWRKGVLGAEARAKREASYM